ncbi:hypothetical protein J6X09_01355 [Candidatus Saccharibacteria bacterium]|nr:hypothetical protein [Candidatus Saccharibacteria bacterium]
MPKIEDKIKAVLRSRTEHRKLESLFRTGNYKVGSNREKEMISMSLIDDVRDITSARQYRQEEKWKYSYVFTCEVDPRTGDVRTILEEIDLSDNIQRKRSDRSKHTWVFTGAAIMSYLDEHPLNIYDQPSRIGNLRRVIDELIIPIRKNRDQVISVSGETETVVAIRHDYMVGGLNFEKDEPDYSISPAYRYDINRVAWCWCLIKVLKNNRPEDFYGSKYDIVAKSRGVQRFLNYDYPEKYAV